MICITGLARVMQKAIEGKKFYSFNGEDTILISENIPSAEQKQIASNLAFKMNQQINVQFSNHLGDIFYNVETPTGFGVKVMPTQSQIDLINEKDTVEDLPTQDEEMEFGVKTLSAISDFLDELGVEQRMVSEFIGDDGNVIENAIAAANFMKGTVDIIDEMEKRPLAWNKLPEEAAHWWYRLLVKDSVLKNALWESAKTSDKLDELLVNQYGEQFDPEQIGPHMLDMLREESIGQLIAEAIKRIEEKNASEEDYSFLKAFVEWINKMLDAFGITTEQDPFEIAAMKILTSDMSDLLTYDEYKELTDAVYFTDIVASKKFNEQLQFMRMYPLLSQYAEVTTLESVDENGNKYRINPISKELNFYPKAFDSLFEAEDYLSRDIHVQQYIDEQRYKQKGLEREKPIIETLTPTENYEKLISGLFRKRSKFLKDTINNLMDSFFKVKEKNDPWREKMFPMDVRKNKFDFSEKFTKEEKDRIIRENQYTTFTPTIRALSVMLQKYKKNPISLNDPIRLDNVSKKDLDIIQNVMTLIKEENPTMRTISSEDLANEVHNYLEMNYSLGFANEKDHIGYRTDAIFDQIDKDGSSNDPSIVDISKEELDSYPVEVKEKILRLIDLTNKNSSVLHNKVSLRFNDVHFEKMQNVNRHFSYNPTAWGNLTYFYSRDKKVKDAVLLHEIQSDIVEMLRIIKSQILNIDKDTDFEAYAKKLSEIYNNELLLSGDKAVEIVKKELNDGNLRTNIANELYKDVVSSISIRNSLDFIIVDLFRNIHPENDEWIGSFHPQFYRFQDRLKDALQYKKSKEKILEGIDNANYMISEKYRRIREINDILKKGVFNILNDKEKEQIKTLENIFSGSNQSAAELNDAYAPLLQTISATITRAVERKYGKVFGTFEDSLMLKFKSLPRTNHQRGNTNLKFIINDGLNRIKDSIFKGIEANEKSILSFTKEYKEVVELENGLTITEDQLEILYDNFKDNIKSLKEKAYLSSKNDNLILIEDSPKEIKTGLFKSKSGIAKEYGIISSNLDLYISKGFISALGNFSLKERTTNPVTGSIDNKYEKQLKKAKEIGANKFKITAIKDSKGARAGRIKSLDALYEISATNGSETINLGLFKYSDIIKEKEKLKSVPQDIKSLTKGLNNVKEAVIKPDYSWRKVVLQTNENYPDDYIFKVGNNYYTIPKDVYEKTVRSNIDVLENQKSEDKIINERRERITQQYNEYLKDSEERYIAEKERIKTESVSMLEDTSKQEEYFLPLVTHLIIKHIKQAGKDVPMYFSGFDITLLTQGDVYATASIYAGPEEVDRLIPKDFSFEGNNYSEGIDNKFYSNDGEISEKEYTKIRKSAIAKRALEVKLEAAEKMGISNVSDTVEEVLKKISEYKKQDQYNPIRFAQKIMEIVGKTPLEIGVLYNAMSKVPGIKLIRQSSIPGIRENTGGYLVDLSNFNYEAPILYSLAAKKEKAKPIKEGVAEVFESNPELVLIGTAQDYSDYLDTTEVPTIEGFIEHIDFKNNVKDYFNLNEEQTKFVQDISNLNINC